MTERRREPGQWTWARLAGLPAGLLWVWAVAWAQAPMSGMMQQVGKVPVEFVYDSWEIDDYGQPSETHRVTGHPASVTAELDGSPVVLAAPHLTFHGQQAVISATGGVTISDGTFSLQARQGDFNLTSKRADFSGEVHWSRQVGQDTSRGTCDWMTLHFAEGGIRSIESGGTGQRPGRMQLHPESGAPGSPGSESSTGGLPVSIPAIERAVAPLEK